MMSCSHCVSSHRMHPRLAAILLCVALVLPVGLAVLGLHQMRERVRHDVKEMLIDHLDRSALVRIALTPDDSARLDWEHAREFRRRGEMYDIVDREAHRDSTIYWCWHDHAESAVVRELEVLLVGGLRHERDAHRTAEHIVRLLMALWMTEEGVDLPDLILGEAVTNTRVVRPTSIGPAPPVPPPDGMA